LSDENLKIDLDGFWGGDYFYTEFDIGGQGHFIIIDAKNKEAFIAAFMKEVESRLRGCLKPADEDDD